MNTVLRILFAAITVIPLCFGIAYVLTKANPNKISHIIGCGILAIVGCLAGCFLLYFSVGPIIHNLVVLE